jgi:outer membrane protein assembly factor BamB
MRLTMNRWLAFSSAVVIACMWTTGNGQDLMPPRVMQQLGLTQAWARPVNVPVGAQSIADQQLFVHQQNPHEYVEVVMVPPENQAGDDASASDDGSESQQPQGKVLVRIPTDRIGADGRPIGRKEAERFAGNEIRRLKRRGIKAEINVRTVPRVCLYTIGTDGTLECRDAESGEPQWMVGVGDRRLTYSNIGVDEDYLTIINGSNLIQIEAATGEVMAEVRIKGVPFFGAINAGDFTMIPLSGGGVEGYPLRDPTLDPFSEIVAGNALAMPTKAPDSSRTAWGTDRGFVYVMEMQGSPSVQFRLNTDGIVSGRLASATGDRFFFGSESGQVYGLRATRSGKVLWSTPVGEPFYNAPMVVGGQLLIRSTNGNLYSMAVESGVMTWERPTPNMGDLIASFDGRLYATSLSGALAVIDVETGTRIGTFSEVRPERLLVNNLTDRLYLVSERGDVQCLKLADSDLPKFNIQPDVESAQEEMSAGPKKEPETTPFGPAGGDPFGAGGADPFGAGGADPFGAGGADPFGGGDDGAMDDPFGGGDDAASDDPFGGNPFGG